MTGPLPSEDDMASVSACDRCGAEHYRGVSFGGRPYCSAECAWDHIADGRHRQDTDTEEGLSPVDMQTRLWAEQAAEIQAASQHDDVCGGAPSADAVCVAAAMMIQPHCAVIAASVSDSAGPMTWSMPSPPEEGSGR